MLVFDDVVRQVSSYIDPGTGSLIIQTLIGIGVGALFVLKTQWRRLRAGVSRARLRRSKARPDDV